MQLTDATAKGIENGFKLYGQQINSLQIDKVSFG
jgi:hypothetical protein